MPTTQFEINYENALQAKDEAQQAYTDANNLYLANQQNLTNAEATLSLYGNCIPGGTQTWWFLLSATSCSAIQAMNQNSSWDGLFSLVWKNQAMHKDGLAAQSAYNAAKARDLGLKKTADDARAAYQQASITAQNAYDDWMEWKVSNMTPDEIGEFQDLEQSASLFGLKMAVWKWIAIGVGLLLFVFAAWWILRKFKVKIPKIIVPDKVIGSAI